MKDWSAAATALYDGGFRRMFIDGQWCEARSGEALKNGEMNLSCAVRILSVTVPRDNVVSRGMKGVAADWGPFHSKRKREGMRKWVREQNYCKAG